MTVCSEIAGGNLIQLITEPQRCPGCATESVFEKLRGCECLPAGGDEWAVWAAQLRV